MKLLNVIGIFVLMILSVPLHAQEDIPLGDVARQSRAQTEMLRKSHPNWKSRTLEENSNQSRTPDWEDSVPDLTGATEIVDKGLALDRQGRFDEALAAYAEAIRVRPNYARAYYDIGVVKGEQGKAAEAIVAYKEAIALDQTHWRPFYNLGTLLSDMGQYPEAIAAYKQAVALDENNWMPLYSLGTVLLETEQAAEAEDVLKKALSLSPDSLKTMMNLGNALGAQRKFEEAIPYFRKILDIAPDWNNARQSLCYSLVQLGRRDEAARVRAEWPSYRPNQN